MFAEIHNPSPEEVLARRVRLGLDMPNKTVRIMRETVNPTENIQFYVRHDIYQHNEALPEPTPEPTETKVVAVSPAESWKIIFQEVCRKHKVSATLIKGNQRTRYIVKARQEMAYRLSTETEMSFPQIANKMGYSDHTTSLYGAKKYKEEHGL